MLGLGEHARVGLGGAVFCRGVSTGRKHFEFRASMRMALSISAVLTFGGLQRCTVRPWDGEIPTHLIGDAYMSDQTAAYFGSA